MKLILWATNTGNIHYLWSYNSLSIEIVFCFVMNYLKNVYFPFNKYFRSYQDTLHHQFWLAIETKLAFISILSCFRLYNVHSITKKSWWGTLFGFSKTISRVSLRN